MENKGSPATKAKNKWNKKNYDQFLLTMQKGDKERYRDLAGKEDMSLNAYIIRAIEEYISHDKGRQ